MGILPNYPSSTQKSKSLRDLKILSNCETKGIRAFVTIKSWRAAKK